MAEPVRKLGPSEEAEGASQFEAAQRRRAMRENSVNGGGQTSGPASAKLSAVRPPVIRIKTCQMGREHPVVRARTRKTPATS